MSYNRNIFWGTVVILNLGIQDKQCKKIAGKIWTGGYPRNLVWDLLDGVLRETKCNTDEDIQKMATAPFRTYTIPYINPDKVILHVWLCLRTTFYVLYFLPLSLHWIRLLLCLIIPQPHFQKNVYVNEHPLMKLQCHSFIQSEDMKAQTGHFWGGI